MPETKPTEVAPTEEKRKARTLAPESEIYIVGKGWMKVSEYAPVVAPGKTAKAHEAFLKAIITEIVAKGPQKRVVFANFAKSVAEEAGLKRKVGFTKYINDGTFGRLPGTLLYGVTRKAEKVFPDLFPEISTETASEAVIETEPTESAVEVEAPDVEAVELTEDL